MTVATLEVPPLAPPARFVPLTVQQYIQMYEEGILEDGAPIELIDGLLTPKDRSKTGEDPMSVGTEHAVVVDKLALLSGDLPKEACYLRAQQPLEILPHSLPEPDGVLIRGTPDDYVDRYPTPADILVIIEVADSSLRFDRTRKLRIYANAGLRHYVILNLVDRVVEDYRDPVVGEGRYATVTRLAIGEMLSLTLPDGTTIQFPVDRFIAARK